MKRFLCAVFALMMACSLVGCGTPKPVEQSIFAMDTYMTLIAYGDAAGDALGAAGKKINALEAQLSRTVDSSAVSQLNKNGTLTPDDEIYDLLCAAVRYADATDGNFDMTIAPIVSAWGITTDAPRVPSDAEIAELLPKVGSKHIQFSDGTVTLDKGCAIDLGGIAKGYASDCVAKIFKEYGVESGTISLGGNVYVCGNKPDGSAWNVAIQDPEGEDYACMLALSDAFAVTSGGYQRNFTAEDGTVYQHIIDPKTGIPAKSDLRSVTVVAENGTMADAYSTALYVMGEQGAIDFWHNHRDDFDMVLITDDGRILYTDGLKEQFISVEGVSYDSEIIT